MQEEAGVSKQNSNGPQEQAGKSKRAIQRQKTRQRAAEASNAADVQAKAAPSGEVAPCKTKTHAQVARETKWPFELSKRADAGWHELNWLKPVSMWAAPVQIAIRAIKNWTNPPDYPSAPCNYEYPKSDGASTMRLQSYAW